METSERDHSQRDRGSVVSARDGRSRVPRPRRARVWRRRLFALALGTVAACCLAEVGVFVVCGPQVRFPRHVVESSWGLRYNQPNAHYSHRSPDGVWQFRINGQGMRADREYSYEKPPHARRIISLGDSFTIGYEADVDECFSSVLEQQLRAAGHNVEVLNAGVSGFSNAEECLYLERELLSYDPDVVIVSFFSNDLIDNVRSNLFKLDERGRLITGNQRYVPAGRLANFLNTNWIASLASERSNAFALVKERATMLIKQRMVVPHLQAVDQPSDTGARRATHEYPLRLAANIFDRMYELLRSKGIPLVIHVIPSRFGGADGKLVDYFPWDYFEADRPGVHLVSAKAILDPYVGGQLLYWRRSHFHWTPLSHRLAGTSLARLIIEESLLD